MDINRYIVFGVAAGFTALLWLILLFVKNCKAKTFIVSFLFILYLAALAVGVIAKITVLGNTITITFDFTTKMFSKYIYLSFENLALVDVAINLAMLVPFGMILGYFFRNKKALKALLVCYILGFVMGLLIELCQFMLPVPRMVQISDVIFNMVGAFVGAMFGFYASIIAKKIYGEGKDK